MVTTPMTIERKTFFVLYMHAAIKNIAKMPAKPSFNITGVTNDNNKVGGK